MPTDPMTRNGRPLTCVLEPGTLGTVVQDDCPDSIHDANFHCECFYETNLPCCWCGKEYEVIR